MKNLFTLILIIFFPFIIHAQVIVGGLVDVEFRKGQLDSSPGINQTPNDKFNIYTPNIRLFGLGVISDKWYAEMALQADYYNKKTLSPVFFSLININWLPIDNSQFMVSAGRFITPYGLQSKRVLSSDNPFVHLPLSHVWALGVDNKTGVYFSNPMYGDGDSYGQSMVYQRMYSQGVKISNNTAQQKLSYEIAATLASASSYFEVGSHNQPNFMGRIAFQPAIWAQVGSSISYGPYMMRHPLNEDISDSDLQSYKQILYGADLTISYLYYSFTVEANFSQWNSPDYEFEDINLVDPVAKAVHYSAELHIQLSFIPGAYTALRSEILRPDQEHQNSQNTYYSDNAYQFGPDVDRLELVFGYRINKNIRAKSSYLINSVSSSDIRANVLAMQFSVGF